MNLSFVYLFVLLFIFFLQLIKNVEAQPPPTVDDPSLDMQNTFRPSLAIVIGVLSIMFSLTFLLLMYAKFCHGAATELFSNGGGDSLNNGGPQPRTRFSGIDKTVIDSLPFFRFSSLKGSKEGLECAVCLSKFEETEILRLLPKCKHAFHIDCVDRWLENHSSCPLCRYKIDPEDLTLFKYSNSMRLNYYDTEPDDEEPNVELFVERETDNTLVGSSSSRFSIGSSFRIFEKGKKGKELLIPGGGEEQQFFHKFKHQIVVSDVVFKNRWSDVNSSDLISLNSDMLRVVSGKRFPAAGSNSERFTSKPTGSMEISEGDSEKKVLKTNNKEENKEMKEASEMNEASESKAGKISRSFSASRSGFPSTSNPSKRSMSEIVKLPRFSELGGKINRSKGGGGGGSGGGWSNAREESVRKVWLQIARRTVQWFAGRERRRETQETSQDLNV